MRALIICFLLTGCADAPQVPSADDGFGETRDARPVSMTTAKADGVCGSPPPGYYRYLDDTACQKRIPTNRDRDLVCPVSAEGARVKGPDGDWVTYRPVDASVEVDAEALRGVVPDDLRITLILVRRVDGVPHYRYLSNGRHAEVVQPWSSTKFMAAANAAATLRIASNYHVGLTAKVDGWPLGDLVTMVHGYDERHFTSNGLARFFHDVGRRDRAGDLVRTWLARPETETFGGNYGAPSAPLPLHFVDADAAATLQLDRTPPPPNQLSTFTIAEFLKRLVMHREDAKTRLPGIQWADVRALFYGAESSRLYGIGDPQGMEADTAVYVQQALDVDSVEARSHGQWRVFSKLGFGPSRGFEFVHTAYACLPSLDAEGARIPDVGREFFIATHMGADGRPVEGDQRLADIYQELVARILDGRLH